VISTRNRSFRVWPRVARAIKGGYGCHFRAAVRGAPAMMVQ
jgi:hypothetical protein